MTETRNGGPGKRRSAASTSPSDAPDSSSPISGSGIDAFLKRLDDVDLSKKGQKHPKATPNDGDAVDPASSPPTQITRRIAKFTAAILAMVLLYDIAKSPPDKRLIGTHRIHDFLFWVKEHPGAGAAAFVLVYASCTVLLLPGTPLTLGGGYVYKVTYGWVWGIAAGTIISTTGSLVGSCTCFILGRYIMRDRVRKWGRKYPLFDAIDIAVSENGFKIMCLLYLTPVLPLSIVSYLLGTTSMPLFKFAAAKIAAVPLMLLYVFIGASTDMLVTGGTEGDGEAEGTKTAKKISVDDETHRKMVFFGLCLSIVSMSLVSHFVKKELNKVSRASL
ncbi:hypothetical protein ACHAWX_004358 [Stephanocyclus meneghinianus]